MTRPYRVLLVESDPGIGGSGRSLHTLVSALDLDHTQAEAVCEPTGSVGRSILATGVPCHWPARWRAESAGRLSRAAWVAWLVRLIHRRRIDLVHVNDIAGFRLTGFAARLARVPSICHVRMARDAEGVAWAFRLARPTAVVFNSQAMANHHGPLLPPAVRDVRRMVLPNAVDTRRFHPPRSSLAAKRRLGWSSEETAVTVVGNLSPLKGQDLFIDMAARVCEQTDRPVRFYLAGRDLTPEGRLTSDLREQARRLGIANRVHFLGGLEDVVPVYQASDILVFPGRATSTCPSGDGKPVFQVGFPRCVIEAAACGKPMVALRIDGLLEAFQPERTGLVVDQGDQAGFVEAILHLIRNPSRRLALGQEARRMAEREFDVEAHARRARTLYENILGQQDRLANNNEKRLRIFWTRGMQGVPEC